MCLHVICETSWKSQWSLGEQWLLQFLQFRQTWMTEYRIENFQVYALPNEVINMKLIETIVFHSKSKENCPKPSVLAEDPDYAGTL